MQGFGGVGERAPPRRFSFLIKNYFSTSAMRRSEVHRDPKTPARTRAVALPPGTPPWITMELIRDTIEVWSPFYKSPISLDEAVTILRGVGQLFDCLSRR
jgi:hypothetical protein